MFLNFGPIELLLMGATPVGLLVGVAVLMNHYARKHHH